MRSLLLSLFLLCSFAQADQTFTLSPFNAITSEGLVNADIDVGSAQSVVFKGSDKTLSKFSLKVVDGVLHIVGPQANYGFSYSDDDKLIITVPSLVAFNGTGVGGIDINNIGGDTMAISYDGVGSLKASGKVKTLKLKGSGVGEIDSMKLIAENVNVELEGVGEAKVYVSKNLDVVVSGIGSLTYFGNPGSIKKKAEGIGSISAGK